MGHGTSSKLGATSFRGANMFRRVSRCGLSVFMAQPDVLESEVYVPKSIVDRCRDQ